MGGFFNIDGPFQKWGTELADFMILSLLWLVCSLPMITLGASTTALYYVSGKKVRGEDPYVFKSFFKSFKENFKQATILTLILSVLWFSVFLYYQIIKTGSANTWVQVMSLVYIIQVTIITLYIFPILSRFEMTIKNLLMSSFVFGNGHIITTIICAVLFVGFLFLVTTPSPIMIVAFGIYALTSSYFLQKVFTKHIEGRGKEEKTKEEDEDEQVNQIENFKEEENAR